MMKMLRRLLLGGAMVLGLALGATQANAVPTLGLMLLIDGSGSISAAEFTLQNNAYASALSAVVPTDGSVAIGVIQFGSFAAGGFQTEFALTTITAATMPGLLATFPMTQVGGGTPTGPAIQAAALALVGLIPTSKTVIDVSTDGFDNVGVSAASAATTAVAGGIDQVNCLGVGPGAVCNFQTGVGSFGIFAANFQDFEVALRGKLVREFGQIPEPASLALFGFGLAALAFFVTRPRRKVAATRWIAIPSAVMAS